MLRKTVQYVDFNGDQQTEVVYFNLTAAELVRLNASVPGGIEEFVANIDAQNSPQEVLDLFERILKASYGVKSEDGRHFLKDEAETAKFVQSAVYDSIFMELISDADLAAAFFNDLVSVAAVHLKNKQN